MDFPETLIRLIEFPTKEIINIISKEVISPISKSLAIVISPLFFQTIQCNPTLKEIYLPINENIEDFFKGKMIDRELFFRMSIILNNKELMKKWKKENEINNENVIDHLKILIQYKSKIEDMEEEINFIGKNFEEFENEIEIDTIPSEYLSEIIKKVKGIKSEEKIKEYIIKRIKDEEDENKRRKLIESIEIQGLNNESIKELIENLKFEDLLEQLLIIRDNLLLIHRENGRELPNKEKTISEEDQEERLKFKELLKEKKEKFIKENEEVLMKKFDKEYQQDSSFQRDPNGFSPLHYAASKNYKEIGEILIIQGADINDEDIIYQHILILF